MGMNDLVGTSSCPHLGFDLSGGRPCCHADDMTRQQCGKFVPNPASRRGNASSAMSGVEAWFCSVLGTDSLPAEALHLAALERKKARAAGPVSEIDPDADPVIPTHTLRAEGKQVRPNDRCPCGSGKKFKKCCANKR